MLDCVVISHGLFYHTSKINTNMTDIFLQRSCPIAFILTSCKRSLEHKRVSVCNMTWNWCSTNKPTFETDVVMTNWHMKMIQYWQTNIWNWYITDKPKYQTDTALRNQRIKQIQYRQINQHTAAIVTTLTEHAVKRWYRYYRFDLISHTRDRRCYYTHPIYKRWRTSYNHGWLQFSQQTWYHTSEGSNCWSWQYEMWKNILFAILRGKIS